MSDKQIRCFLLIACAVYCSAFFNMEDIIGTAADVKQYLHTQCVFMLYFQDSNLEESTMLLQYKKRFSNKFISLAMLNISKVTSTKCHKSRPLYILIYNQRSSLSKLNEARLSDAKWLLFTNSSSMMEKALSDVNVPFDCEFLVAHPEQNHVRLTEVYRISPAHHLKTHHFGNWTPRGLSWPTIGFNRRRSDLEGLVLKTVTMNEGDSKITKEKEGKALEVGGYFGDIWTVLQTVIKFRSDYYEPSDHAYGAEQDNGSWSGMVGMVMRNEVHISSTNFIYNIPRMFVVDFLNPVGKGRLIMYIKTSETTDLHWESFLYPLKQEVWVALGMIMLFVTVIILLSHKLFNHYVNDLKLKAKSLGIFQALLLVFGAFCMQGNKEPMAQSSVRMVHLTTYLTAVILGTCYSASLLSNIMTTSYEVPFNNFREFLNDGTYQLGVRPNSAHIEIFKESRDPVLRAVYRKHIAPYESSLPSTIAASLNRACARSNYAPLGYSRQIQALFHTINCTLHSIRGTTLKVPGSIIIQKKSPYKRIFKYTLNEMLRNGMLQRITNVYNPQTNPSTETDFSSVTLRQAVPIFVLLSMGVVTSACLLMFEVVIHRCNLRAAFPFSKLRTNNKRQAKIVTYADMRKARGKNKICELASPALGHGDIGNYGPFQ